MRTTDLRMQPDKRGPLSYGQQRLWFLDRWMADSPAYNVPVVWRFRGPLHLPALTTALAGVAARHDVLFTVFEENGAGPRQRVLDSRELACPVVDLTGEPDPYAMVDGLIDGDARRPFDLTAGPMLRATVYRLADDEHWLHVTFHHIACDGWSLEVFQRQLVEAYEHGGEPVAGRLPVQYADYALWQRESVAGPRAGKALEAWSEALRGAPPVLDLGADRTRPAERGYHGETATFPLDDVPVAELEALAAAEGVSLYTVLLAAFQALAARHAGSDDIVLGSPVAGRGPAKLDQLVGFFVDTLVVRVGLDGEPTFRELVGRCRTAVLDALTRTKVPFDVAVNHLHPERSLSRTPIVQVLFALNEDPPPVMLGEHLTLDRTLVPTGTAKFDLTWSVHRTADRLLLAVEYATDLYDAATVRTLADHWRVLLRAAVTRPDANVADLDVTTPSEQQLIASWSGSDLDLPVATIPTLIRDRAARNPHAVALVDDHCSVTYAELTESAGRIAGRLRKLGVGPETCVGVCTPRSADMVVAALGVLFAGAAYVPLDPDHPAERLHHMLHQTGARHVLTTAATAARIPAGGWQLIDIAGIDDPPSAVDILPGNACYVIFTSGSTGRPKGTVITHANVTRMLAGTRQHLPLGPDDVWTLFHSFAFDFSVFETWGALTTGGRLVVVDQATSRDPQAFYETLRLHGVTILCQTPSAFRQVETVDSQQGARLALRAVVFGGEALHQPSVRRWAHRHGYDSPRLINMYGITETTVHVTYHEVTENDLTRAHTTVGRPLPDLHTYVLDERGSLCPIGVVGEIHVAGPGVARGYVGDPALTAQRFVPDHLAERDAGFVPDRAAAREAGLVPERLTAPDAGFVPERDAARDAGGHGGFGSGSPRRLYRSGDLARWTPDGRLEYFGRADSQVKIRGHRIELDEIQVTLEGHQDVNACVIAVTTNADGRNDLVAYVVAGTPIPVDHLRDWVRARLPEYMVPWRFVMLDALPLTTQGKVDRRALPAVSAERPQLEAAFVAPQAGVEQTLADIWCRVLGVDRVGREDNFFDLGGDSIRSIQVLGAAREAGISFTLQDLFRHPTVAQLAPATTTPTGARSQDRAPFALLSAEDRERLPDGLVDAYPMAELQVGMVYEMERAPDRRPYHNVDSVRIGGPFDETCFRTALDRVVHRHPVFRTSFDLTGFSQPLQLVHPEARIPLVVADLRGEPEQEQDQVLIEYVASERGHHFDHSRPPLLRMAIHRLTDDVFQLTLTEHHAILDGWSLHSTMAEIVGRYSGLLAGEDRAIEPPRSTYRDFIAAEQEAARSAGSETYWRERLAGRPDTRVPRWPAGSAAPGVGETMPDEWREANPAGGYGSVETALPEDLCDDIQAFAKRCGVPVKDVVLAAHLFVVGMVSGSPDVVVGLTSNGRLEEVDGEEVRGLFLNTVPFRFQLPRGSWRDLVREVFEAEREMVPHRRYPMSVLQRKLGNDALFETCFVYNHFHVLSKAFNADGIKILDGKIDSFTTRRAEPNNFALTVGVLRNPYSSGLLLCLDYDPGALVEDQVLLMRDYHVRVLRAMVADPAALCDRALLLGVVERGLLSGWGGSGVELPVGLVHELVAARAVVCPGAVAVSDVSGSLSYAELVSRADVLAGVLRGLGVGPEVFVGVCVPRSVELVVAALAVLRAGGAYVPLDPEYPGDRLRHMLVCTGAVAVLVSGETADVVPAGQWRVVDVAAAGDISRGDVCVGGSHVDGSHVDGARVDGAPVGGGRVDSVHVDPVAVDPGNACYVIFTSGSSGEPKGTVVTHANVSRLLAGVPLPVGGDDVWTLFHSFAFDFSVWEAWGALVSGGRLVVVDRATSRDTSAFYDLVAAQRVTVLSQTPSAFRQFEAVDAERHADLALRAVVFGGEALDQASVARWASRHGYGSPRLINMYGITETTVHVTYQGLGLDDLGSIGRPLPDLRVRVLNAWGQLCPIGVTGEMFVAGPGLARGYLGEPALTAERFVPGAGGRRWYRTGDLGRWRPDGRLEHRGRADAQVKIRGHRVEPGEVQRVLESHPQVRQSVVVAQRRPDGQADLVAYVAADEQIATDRLREWLRGRLPDYMVPWRLVHVDAVPLTPQGKTDVRALPAVTDERPHLQAEYVAPEAGVEHLLALAWSRVLGVDRIGRHDNLFDLGADSIRSIQALGQARQAGLSFGLPDLFSHNTLAELATVTTAHTDVRERDRTPFAMLSAEDRALLPAGLQDAYPMAELQIGMVFETERDSARRAYHNVHTFQVNGAFHDQHLRTALSALITRHPILRTSFDLTRYSEPLQLVHPVATTPLTVHDVQQLTADDQRAAVDMYVCTEQERLLDLSKAPLFRAAVHVLSDSTFQLTVTEHHAILDGWSLASTLTELTENYQQLAAGQLPPAPPLRSTYRDFVAAERRALESADSKRFWLDLLAEPPSPHLPSWPENPRHTLGQRVAGQRHVHTPEEGHGALHTPLPPYLAEQVETFAQQAGVPLKTALLTAHLRVVALITGNSDVIVGLTSNGRLEEVDGTDARGLFLNTAPLRLRLPQGDWHELARAVYRSEQAIHPHRRYPMAALQRELGGGPLFGVSFTYNHFHQFTDAIEYGTQSSGIARTNFPLVVAVSREPGTAKLTLELEYDARLITADQATVIRDQHLRVLAGMTREPHRPHHRAVLLGQAEQQLIAAWNDTCQPVPSTLIHELIAAKAVETPDAVAVADARRSVSCAELDAEAHRLALHLRALGVGPETFVGVAVPRSVDMVVACLAVLKAGGAYVPLDLDHPADRLRLMLEETGASLVLTSAGPGSPAAAGPGAGQVDGDLLTARVDGSWLMGHVDSEPSPVRVDGGPLPSSRDGRIPAGDWRVLDLGSAELAEQPVDGALPVVRPDNACYVIFTSGSTGRPKGVVTRHRNVVELLYGGYSMALRPTDTVLQIATAAFDVSTYEIWAPLAAGARLVMAPAGRYGPEDVARWVGEHAVTVLHVTASLLALLVEYEPRMFAGLRRVLTGSETVSPAHAARLVARFPELELVNCWGPTETTTFSVCGVFTRDTLPAGPVPLGTPLANTEVWVLDEAGEPVPVGTPGELYVAGPCLARGYLASPALTAERFLPHPTAPGRRLYRTGDRGRWSLDGHVEFLGRVDHMVKVRGYRVELGEVEATLGGHEQIRAAAVTVHTDADGRSDLVAYVVPAAPIAVEQLRDWVRARLPEYMVPWRFVMLGTMPLTAQGKVDRRALPAVPDERPRLESEFVAPRAGVEQTLADIWCRVLGVDRVGRADNFFDLGGDSIRSIQVLGAAREAGIGGTLQDLFQHPILSRFAAAVRSGPVQDETPEHRQPFALLAPADRERLPEGLLDAYPMAELQVGMVYEMDRDPDRNPYHNVHTLRVNSPFDEGCFRAALQRVIDRHPIFRTTFDLTGYSEPIQLVHATANVPLQVYDVQPLAPAAAASIVDDYVDAEQQHLFDLTVAPLFRAGVHVLDPESFQLTVTEHHAVLDGWSLASTLAEIAGNYQELLAGRQPLTIPLRSTYRDFVAAEREAARSADSAAYWKNRLSGHPATRLPRRGADPVVRTGEQLPGEQHRRRPEQGYGSLDTVLPRELLLDLQELARQCGVPLKDVVLAAHLFVVGMVSGNPDVVVGVTSNGRLEEVDGEEARGLFLNTVPFRFQLPRGSWRDLVREVFEAEREMMPHRRYPMSLLQRQLGNDALFDINFTYHHFRQLAGLAADATGQSNARTNFPLVVAVSHEPGAGGLVIELEYDARELTADQVTTLRDYHVRVLQAMVADPAALCDRALLLGVVERGLLSGWGGSGVELPVGLVHELVAARAVVCPGAVAVSDVSGSLSYAELVSRADVLAGVLRGLGVGPEVFVGVCVPRSVELVVAALAVLRAGGAYVPLDPEYPGDRLRHMLVCTGAVAVLVSGETAGVVPDGTWQVIDVSKAGDSIRGDESGVDRACVDSVAVDPGNACYVIFTSGSSGEPKGTVVTHANVSRLLAGVPLPVGGDDVWTLFHSFAFDFSVWEAWGALVSGGRLVVVDRATSRDTSAFYDLVAAQRVTVLSQTPSAFRQFEAVDAQRHADLALRAVVFGGETLDQASVRRWADRHGCTSPRLINMYGITETTVHVTYQELGLDDLGSIGRPLPDLRVRVLNAWGQLCPIGVTGEMFVAGPGLARGYLGEPALTAERFVPGAGGRRWYRTGDLGRWRPDGRLEHRGRADAQVKIRGHRVEPGEVQRVLEAHTQVRQSVVVAQHRADGQADLVAYLVADQPVAVEELRDWVRARLPEAMVPWRFAHLESLPLTAQGKTDVRALPAVGEERPQLQDAYVAPLPGTEEVLAGVWSRVLGVDRVGRHDNLFDLGADSIRSIQAIGEARKAGISFGLPDLFAHPTPAGLAPVCTAHTYGATTADQQAFTLLSDEDRALLPPGLHDAYPMAALQVGMVYEMERDAERRPYHNVHTSRAAMAFHERHFRTALSAVIARHPVLRTSFDLTGFSQPMQLVHASVPVPLSVHDLRGLAAGAQRDVVVAYVRGEQDHLLELSEAPLFRMAVHVLDDNVFQMTMTEQHAILDGWSLASTLEEITAGYEQLQAGRTPAPLPPPRSTYRDYIAAEQVALESADTRAFWRELLADRPRSDLPRRTSVEVAPRRDMPRQTEAEQSARQGVTEAGGSLHTTVPASLQRDVEAFARQAGVPLKSALLAAHLRVVALTTGSSDVIVGLTSNGRLEEVDATDTRGLFLNTVPLRLRLPEGDWRDFARTVHRSEMSIHPHRRFPVSALQQEFGGPLFSITFTYNRFHQLDDITGRDGEIGGFASTNFPLGVTFVREPGTDELSLDLDYDPRQITATQAAAFRDHHLRVLSEMTVRPGEPHRYAELLTPDELALLDAWNDTRTPASGMPVHELLRERARREPDRIAVEAGAVRMSLAELDAGSDRLALRLHRDGVRRGDLVGLRMAPGMPAVVAMFGIWKAGAAFLALDPALPPDRLRAILDDARPALVLDETTDSAFATQQARPGETRPQVRDGAVREGEVRANDAEPGQGAEPAAADPVGVGANDLAYVMYTSGTTGQPKGVLVEHGSLSNFVSAQLLPRIGEAGAHLRVVGGTSAFVTDFFLDQVLHLIGGHTVVALDEEQRRDPGHLTDLAQDPDRALDVVSATTPQVELYVGAGLLDAPYPPKVVIIGGEACPPDLWAALRDRTDVLTLNTYGPTESTVDATYARIADSAGAVIGFPYGNTEVLILDADGNRVPPGTVGEVCLGGPGVGRGYLNRPVATAERFVPHPWGPAGSRLYRTGDLGRHRPDGRIEFLGRMDRQLKVGGLRIEPGEVEAVLCAHPGVVAARVAVRPGGAGLIADVTAAEGWTLDQRELRRHARASLPDAAVPAVFRTAAADAGLRTAGETAERAAGETAERAAGETAERAAWGTAERAARETAERAAGETAERAAERAAEAEVVVTDGPRTATEQRVAEVWSRLLGLPGVGVHDDFFDVGGHSLLAVQVAAELVRGVGRRVPVAPLYAATTVAGQAAYLDRVAASGQPGGGSRVVRLGGLTGGPPLVLVHPLGGTLFCYRDLIGLVGSTYEVLGVHSDFTACDDLGVLTRRYADELDPVLRGRRPVLAGWSAGGVLAHEIAARLQQRGTDIGRVVLIDAELPAQRPLTAAYDEALRTLPGVLAAVRAGRSDVPADVDDLLAVVGVDRAGIATLDEPAVASLAAFWQGMLRSLAGHQPSVFTGTVDLILAAPADRQDEAVAGWAALAGELRVTRSAADHFQLLRFPDVSAVAEVLCGRTDLRTGG
ncbi:non-ribosomal peptide synthetase [Actinoplanes sp. N902-109]|uniref:non-ribosomal peptide synthetase n=1 Tax=Actinoplanes sp. (strain N902-109) TaxID=649831 RepID=UPI00032959C7|nr:non-ribosomal peptide synthetase [Actinoplanes sp. N902-109]AGL19084.1 amino acid adenylation domain-containing protein [Actinoplanes sp. N902-109]